VKHRMNSGEPGGNWGVIMERSGLMSSEMTEPERDGGLKADGETVAWLREEGGEKLKAASSTGATQRGG
jgi:hypothetical protein